MKNILFSEIIALTDSKLIKLSADCKIEHLVIDSRKAAMSQGSVFFAIKGKNHDGHLFIEDLYKNGIRHFVVENFNQSWLQLANCSFIETKSAIECIQSIASEHRRNINIPVLAITGSNAKTIIKEWISQLLSSKYQVVKSPKSYNSQIGVPLSVWEIDQNHTFGVFEAGISQKNEMQHLSKIIQPTLGLMTNIGTAHDEGFESENESDTGF